MTGIDRDSVTKIAIIWQRFLPYHMARIKALKIRCDELGYKLFCIEVASKDETYSSVAQSTSADYEHICAFPDTNYHMLDAAIIHARVLKILEELNPDVIFSPATPFPEGMAAIAYRTKFNKKVIMMDDAWEMSDIRGRFVIGMKRIIHKNVDAVFIPAKTHSNYFASMDFHFERQFFGVDVVDNNYYQNMSDNARQDEANVRALFRLPENYFLFVGRLISKKGLQCLLAAYEKYSSLSGMHKWDLVIVGDGDNMKQLRESCRANPRIHFAGAQAGDNLAFYYGLARVLVVSSIYDQWALVINEGMASGLPIIASRGCGATQTLVQQGDNGWRFDAGDVEALSELMLQAASAGPDTLREMGKRSLDIIKEWGPDLFADSAIKALDIPRRKPAGFIANGITYLWKGHVRTY